MRDNGGLSSGLVSAGSCAFALPRGGKGDRQDRLGHVAPVRDVCAVLPKETRVPVSRLLRHVAAGFLFPAEIAESR